MTEEKQYLLTHRVLPFWRKFRRVYLVSILSALVIVALIWELLASQVLRTGVPGPVLGAGLLFLSAVLAGVIAWGLSPTALPKGWRYRGAAGLSLLAGSSIWLSLRFSPSRAVSLGTLIPCAAGALIGSMIASWVREGYYENNQPPSAQIRREVVTRHQELIGNPGRGSLPKRLFDVLLAGLGLLISAPVWLFICLLIWLEDPGPLVFIKNSVGRGGKNFHQFKFRTMVSGAEIDTGPIPARESDSRVLKTGTFLRKTALDELPQLVNILKGEMSFVGPRPQRTVLVYLYLRDLPEFAGRHAVLPGLAGLAQVAGDYFVTPRQKLRYDRLYARHASLGFDLKLLAIAFALVFWLRWRGDWDGRIPRAWLRWPNR